MAFRVLEKQILLVSHLVCLCLLILFVCETSLAADQVLPRKLAVPGGVSVIPLPSQTMDTVPEVYFQQQRVMVLRNQNSWHAVLGIPLSTKPGSHALRINGGQKSVRFMVDARQYAEQRLIIKNKRQVNPNADDMKRIRGESVRIKQALRQWTPQEAVETHFMLPVAGRLSSPFG